MRTGAAYFTVAHAGPYFKITLYLYSAVQFSRGIKDQNQENV